MNSELVRLLNLKLPQRQSAFLWGARQTGKSTFLKQHYQSAIYYDLLQTDQYLRLSKAPHLLREELLAMPKSKFNQPVIIDEIQKIPLLLNEVHWLIENANIGFILCGSSARKLKHGAANLLGGRAWRYTFYPLVSKEIPKFNLLHALNYGLIPRHYLTENPRMSLRSYVVDYLREEIQAEGLVRNLPAFAKFLDAAAFSNGEMLNYSNVARDCGIDSKTVKEYYEILVDTLLGYLILPYNKQIKRSQITATPKFYLFDTGVANFIAHKHITSLQGADAGKALEQFILMELIAYRGLNHLDYEINYWRTKTGLEVDFILNNGAMALEVKINNEVRSSDIRGLIAFSEEHKPQKSYVISQDKHPRLLQKYNITVLPWQDFLSMLWGGEFDTWLK